MSINRVTITGNLTRDPDLRTTANGNPVLGLGVAVNDRHKNQQTGEWEDYPNFIDCTMFGSRAEKITHYLTKGMKVAIEGRLRWSQWEKDGQKRSKVEVIIEEIEFMTNRSNVPVQQPQMPPQQSYQPPQTYAQTAMPGMPTATPSMYDADVPF